MAGKHYGNAAYVNALTSPPAYPGSKENQWWTAGWNGGPTPPATDPVAVAAYNAGAGSNSAHEAGGTGGSPVLIGGNDQSSNPGGAGNWRNRTATRAYAMAIADYINPAGNGTVTKLLARVFKDSGATDLNIQLALYETDGDNLGARVGVVQTTPAPLTGVFGTAYTVEFAVSLPISAGTAYAIAVSGDSSFYIADVQTGSTNTNQGPLAAWPSQLADPFGVNTAFTGDLGLWCEYTLS